MKKENQSSVIVLVLFLAIVASSLSAQTIKRWPNGKTEITSKKLSFKQHTDIFRDFKWTYPDVKSNPLTFKDGKASFQFTGKTFYAELSDNKIRVQDADGTRESAEQISKGNMYYDKSNLKLKAVTQNVWTSYTSYTSRSVPVQRSRQVTSYSYVNGRSTPVYRTEHYTAYEHRSVPETRWHYVPRTTWVIDIPSYPYYSFSFNDSSTFVIYKADKDKYYVQNSSYLIASDNSDINHIFIDANADGDFLDGGDKVMFNSWNPYSSNSSYKGAGAYRENKWYDIDYLNQSNFVTFAADKQTGTLEMNYENTKYVDEDEKGKVTFTNLPDDIELYVNGREYSCRKSEKKFKSQYGKFLVRIARKGYLDFEKTYTVEESSPELVVKYVTTAQAGKVKLENIFEPNYFITVSDSNGYSRTYNNARDVSVPVGKSTVSIYSNGFTLNREVQLLANETDTIDFENEVKKLKSEAPLEDTPEKKE